MSKRKTDGPELRLMVYDAYYGDFVLIENASFDVSTTPDASVEMFWPTANEPTTTSRSKAARPRCDICRERKRSVERCSDGLLVVCRVCARGDDVSAFTSGEVIDKMISRAPANEHAALRRGLDGRRGIRLRRNGRKANRH